MMEWATQWVGAEGKIHADKRTVEYCGRGNHSADAVCVVGSISVGNVYETRVQAAEFARERKAPCLSSPFEDKPSVNGARTEDHVKEESNASASVASAVDGVAGNGRKHKKSQKGASSSKSHKKRRVEKGDGEQQDADAIEKDDEKASIPVLRLPVYYFEVQILATRSFQGTTPFSRHTRLLNDSDDEEEEEGGDDSEMRDDDSASVDDDDDSEDSGDVPMEVDILGDSRAPWRSRARRLIHDHIRATAGENLAAGAVVDDAVRVQPNGNGGTNGGGGSQLMRSSSLSSASTTTANSLFSLPSPPPSAQQQMLLSFPLSSSTIEQIRLRLERQQQQAHSQRRRLSATSPPGSFSAGAVSLSTAISSIHARHQRRNPDVRRKRSSHRISVGFMLGKDDNCDHIKRDLGHDELGRHACSIAFVGKTGSILSNGQTFLETDTTFGYGDTVGCGVILDTRTFFWTVNGRVVATIAATDVHHLDDYEDHSVDSHSNAEWFMPWADQLVPAVSLHEHGECVRALFTTSETESFRFDLEAFKQQELRGRQEALAAYASGGVQNLKPHALHEDDEIMHQLVEDYFTHYGYGNALSALRDLHQSDHTRSLPGSDSVASRHEIRQLIYAFKTREALTKLETKWKRTLQEPDSLLPLYCRILSVVDILHAGKSSVGDDNLHDAVAAAQDLLQDYVTPKKVDSSAAQHVRAFVSVLLYPSVDQIPTSNPGRRFLVWKFREEVADCVNESLLESGKSSSALERLTEDLSELQRQCVSCGATAFPPCSGVNHPKSCYSCSRRKHGHPRHKLNARVRVVRLDVDSEDDNDASGSSSSGSSGSENDEEDDD